MQRYPALAVVSTGLAWGLMMALLFAWIDGPSLRRLAVYVVFGPVGFGPLFVWAMLRHARRRPEWLAPPD